MSSPVQVKHEPGGDAFCVDTDSECEDIDIDKLQPLAPKFASLSKFPVGCKVWYDLRCAPKTNHLQAKSARVEEVFIHFENGRRVYKVKSEAAYEHGMCLYEDQLVYAISCPVRVTKLGTDETMDGVVVYLRREKGSDGRRQIIYAVQYSTENCMTIESGVAADRIKYRAEDCVGDDGRDNEESNISIDKQKETTCAQEEDEFISDDEDGAKKQAGKEGKGGGTATRRSCTSKESAPVGLKASLKTSGAGVICLHKEGDAKELKEPSSAQTDSVSIPAAVSPAEEGKRGANNSSTVIGDGDGLTIQKDNEKKRSRRKKLKKQQNAAQESNPLPQPQNQAVPVSSTQKPKRTACTQEGDTDKEHRETEDLSRSSSVESFAQIKGNDHNDCNQSNSLGITSNRWEPPSPPPPQRKRSSGSKSIVNHRPTKVAKREVKNEERGDVARGTSRGKAANTAAVRILTIPPWWRSQWGPENRRQLCSHLIGKVKYVKSSTNCLIRISWHDTHERMRITIESLSRDPKSQLNSLRRANYIIEKALVECLADENSKTRLLYDLAFSNSFQLTHRDSTSGLLLLQKEIKGGSHASKSKEWWHLYELPCRWEMHQHDLSSIRLKLPKGSDCKIEIFGCSVKVSRESPYVLVSGTKQLDVKNAAMMVADAVRRHQSGCLPCPPKPKR
ncbi:hypothetical protein QTG54_009321 [Skeletonema marinoi]|uniref:Uncharacterized protein n=1 Tax=Skeletonema marinoi TaxID=267567 RepID=A0AAD8Y7V7_9STRA|nr:hypothetical protein QTG54_009321 [Skeletonema marinoi]